TRQPAESLVLVDRTEVGKLARGDCIYLESAPSLSSRNSTVLTAIRSGKMPTPQCRWNQFAQLRGAGKNGRRVRPGHSPSLLHPIEESLLFPHVANGNSISMTPFPGSYSEETRPTGELACLKHSSVPWLGNCIACSAPTASAK